MFSKLNARKPLIAALTVSILILALALGPELTLAGEATQANTTGWGDEGTYEVGVEWMNIFPDPAANRDYWNVSCDGVYNFLVGAGWTPRFRWVNYDAYEKDFKNDALGGWQSTYSDAVDLAMVCTHGSTAFDNKWQKNLSAVYFGSTMDDHYLSPGEAYLGFGDQDLEYLAFDSCAVLADPSVIYWASTFNGLHLMLGFSNNMHVDPYGDGWLWGFFMTHPSYPSTVTQSWFSAVDFNQPSDVCARVIAEDLSNFNEYWWNTWPDPAVNSEKWISSHCSHGIIYGKEAAEQTNLISVPIVQVLDRTVNEDYVRDLIAPAFELTGPVERQGMFFSMGQVTDGITETLLVDTQSGGYSYHNLSKLWTTPVITPTLPENGRIANLMVNNWFSDPMRRFLPGANYRNYSYLFSLEGVYSELLKQSANGELTGQVTSNIPTDVSMTYPRVITATAGTAQGTQLATYPLFGPGARTVVYLGDQGEVIGVQGGSRDVNVLTDMVELLDPNVVWDMFLETPSIAIGEIPFIADTITHTLPIQGYYEMPYFVHQDELIPVYEFRSWFYQAGKLVAGDYPVYLPAAAMYLPSQATILNPPDGSTFSAGDLILFEGEVTGGTPPFAYKWTSSSDGILGDTLDVVHTIGSEIRTNTVFNPTISFQVTDANGLVSTDTITLAIKPIFWLPFVKK